MDSWGLCTGPSTKSYFQSKCTATVKEATDLKDAWTQLFMNYDSE